LLLKGEPEELTEYNQWNLFEIVQLKHDSSKLVTNYTTYVNTTIRVWDIHSSQCLYTINRKLIWSLCLILELGSRELLVAGPGVLTILNPLDSTVLATIRGIRYDRFVQLSNGNLVSVYKRKNTLFVADTKL